MEEWSGSFELVNPRDIVVDHRYQRPEKPDLVTAIAGNPLWAMFGVVQCAKRSNSMLYCFDGQQRLAGFLRSDKPPLKVPVVCFPVVSAQDEARLFCDLNSRRKGVSAFEMFNGRVFQGNDTVLAINAAVLSCGFTIGQHGNQDPRSITAVTSIQHVYNHAGEEGIRQVLVAIREAWPDDRAATTGFILRALGEIVGTHNGSPIARPKLVAALARTTPSKILREAEALKFDLGGSKGENVRRAFRKLAKIG